MTDHPLEREAEILAEEAYDASDRKTINAALKKAAREERKRLEFVHAIMKLKEGRKWAYDQLVKCKVFSTPFILGSIDGTSFNCGQQNWGLQFLADITNASPDEFVLMMKESKQ